LPEAREFYEKAIALHQGLAAKEPGNREYRQELAVYNNNLAMLLIDQREFGLAEKRNGEALTLIEELARPALSLGMELAKVHSLRCQITESQGTKEALRECQQSLDILNQLAKIQASRDRSDFQMLYRDLGYNYVELAKNSLSSGALAEAETALDALSKVLPKVSEAERTTLTESYRQLQQGFRGRLTNPQ
jgi:hypothetical protein